MGNFANMVCERDLLVALKFLSVTLTFIVSLSEAAVTVGVGWRGNARTEGFLRWLVSGVKVGPWTRRCRCGSAASRLSCRAAPAPMPGREASR